MNFQEKVSQAAVQFRTHVESLAQGAIAAARNRQDIAERRIADVRKSFAVLTDASHEFNQIARRHAGLFVKENSPLITAARKDVSKLARATFSALRQNKPAKSRKPSRARSASASRKPAAKTA